MPKLPKVTGKQLLRFLGKQGFEVLRQRGSHYFLEHKTKNIRTTVPVHGKEILRPGILLAILADIGMNKDEFCAQYK